MNSKRAQTLESLSAFIDAQKALLARTQSDITRLIELRSKASVQQDFLPSEFVSKLRSAPFKLSEQLDAATGPPETLDWSAFASQNPEPLERLAASSRADYAQRNQPHTFQRSGLSYLQIFVKNARKIIVDPVLEQLSQASHDATDSEPDIDGEAETERRRQKFSRLQKRRVSGGLTIPHPAKGACRVFVRRDLEDESGEVDIFDDDRQCDVRDDAPMDIDTPPTSLPSTAQATPPPQFDSAVPTRARRPTYKLQTADFTSRVPRRKTKQKPLETEAEPEPPPPTEASNSANAVGPNGKARSATYKLAWSLSEQHLLERLLQEIPDGEKQRWLKISRAMNGRRTPKQVASRVQKYFEKLKQFGLKVDTGASGAATAGVE